MLHSVTALLYLQVESITPVVYLFRLMQGLGHVCVFTPLFVEVGKIIPDRFKARGIGYFAVAIQFGTASGSAVGDYVIKNHDWKTYFITIAVITFVCACVCQFIKGESGSGKEKQVKDSGNSYVANMNLVYGGLIMIFVLGAVFGTILQFVPTYFDKLLDTGIIEKEISCKLFLTSGLFTVAMIRIIGGGITDGRHRDRVVIFCHIGLMLTLFLITLIRSGGFSLFVSVIFGLSYGLLYPTTNAMVLTNSKESVRGRVSGLLTMLFEAGFRGFALIAGAVVGAAGYFSMFYFLLAFYVVGVLLFMFLQYKGRFFLRGSYEN
ncbi:MAG: MFS transporter [Gammaproteobacteria bacterium]|nr:MAG: MFS transporter [Gammaproteobacteria bacterium]